MILDVLKEFALALLRSLFMEELCQRVKEALGAHGRRRHLRRQALLHWLQVRQRERLLHKLGTEREPEL